ncbi:hypothetical protein CASFOL_016198 [Castilleja foliolosa]|uniref:Uncharacterized protein n=1 Tax=Castilleja foliolosa TaxID=1961234 RepID=A0ABD3DK36_9LAMI
MQILGCKITRKFYFRPTNLSDVVSESSKRSKEASKKSKEFAAEALKRADQITAHISPAQTNIIDSAAENHKRGVEAADLEKYEVTDDLREFIKEIIMNTFENFPLEVKYEEICAPQVEEFCYITDNTYFKEEVLQMESNVLNYLKFEMTALTVKCFLRRFVCAAKGLNEAPLLQLECLANYVAELSLLEYNMLCFAPSLIAVSSIFLAKFIHLPSRSPWLDFVLLALIWEFDVPHFYGAYHCNYQCTIMTVSKDRVKPSPLPDSCKLADIFATGVVLGGYLAMMTAIFFWAAYKTNFFLSVFGVSTLEKTAHDDFRNLTSSIYLQVELYQSSSNICLQIPKLVICRASRYVACGRLYSCPTG